MDYGLADGSKEPNLLTVTLHARQPEAGLVDFVVDSILRVTFLSGRRVLAVHPVRADQDHPGRDRVLDALPTLLRAARLARRERHDHTGWIGGMPGRMAGADVRHEAPFRSEGSPRSRMVPDDPGGFSTVGTT